MRGVIVTALGVALGLAVLAAPAAADDGEKLFKQKCGACHALDKHKTGPLLGGVIGRAAGTTDFNRYKGLVNADFAWTPELLDEYLVDPKAFVLKHTENKTSSMAFKLKDAADRTAVIEYLKTTGQ